MRVISGTYKGRPLKAVKGNTTRPTTDKIKESIFNMIGPYFDGGIGLDLYAGSGGLGIEALSRGLTKVIFVDKHPKAIETIKENIATLSLEDQTEVYRNDAFRALKAVCKRELQFSLIILDPPYKVTSITEIIEFIAKENLLQENGVILTEHDSKLKLPEQIHQFKKERREVYNDTTTVSIYSG